jgi:hypothetical protein
MVIFAIKIGSSPIGNLLPLLKGVSWLLLSDVKHRLEYKLNRKKQRPHLRKSKQTGTALMANKKVSQQLLTLEHKLEKFIKRINFILNHNNPIYSKQH